MTKSFLTTIIFFTSCFFTILMGEENEKLLGIDELAPLFHLMDQYGNEFSLEENIGYNIVLLIGNRSAKKELGEWGSTIKDKYGEKLKYFYIISMPDIPFFLKGWVIDKFKGESENTGEKKGSVYLDWDGVIYKKYSCVDKSTNIIFINEMGIIKGIETGKMIDQNQEKLFKSIEDILDSNTNIKGY